MNQNEKLRQFTASIEDDVRNESQRILDEVRREVDSAMHAAEDDILGETFRFIKNEVARERMEMGRNVSRRMMENKNKLNNRREAMGELVMKKVVERLAEYVKTEEYAENLIVTAREILNEFNHAETVLYLRKADLTLEKKLREGLKNEPITVKEGNFELGGIMGTCPATHTQIDASFDTKFSELDGHFAEMFGLQLSQ